MEILFALLKYLTASLTPAQFLSVAGVTLGIIGFVGRFAFKRRKALMAILGKGEDENLKLINVKLEKLQVLEYVDVKLEKVAKPEDLEKILANFTYMIRNEIAENAKALIELKEQLVEISLLRQEIVDKEFVRLFEELQDIKKSIEHTEDIASDQRALILASSNRSQEITSRTLSQVEKIDEFLKAAVPEFRSYHREISTDVKMLSRDLALIERSIQLGINSPNAVKLR